MIRQSTLTPRSMAAFNTSPHMRGGGDFISHTHTSLLIMVCWTKTVQVLGNNHLLAIPQICNHPADPM